MADSHNVDDAHDGTGEANNLASVGGFDPAAHIEGFDPSVHAVDAAGLPIPSASGAGYRKKRGRKAGKATSLQKATIKTSLEKQAQKVSAETIAKSFINLGVGGAAAFIGDEWNFQNKQEADDMVAAVAGYIEAKSDVNISPEIMLLLVVGSYSMSRLSHENTQTKIGKFFGGAWNMLKKLFNK